MVLVAAIFLDRVRVGDRSLISSLLGSSLATSAGIPGRLEVPIELLAIKAEVVGFTVAVDR